MTRVAPYRHADGSNCWTKNCSRRGDHSSSRDAFINQVRQHAVDTEAPKLSSIAPMAEFEREVAEKFIHIQHHPTLPLDIYDYTQLAQFKSHWTPATLASRGLIVNRDTLEIVSRPLGKFFNHSEGKIDPTLLQGSVVVTDKLDGSMGISYPTPEGLAISTRGSFTSEQALHATAVYRERYEGKWRPRANRTYMWEIIYPNNRIVVDYGEMDDIVLIAAVDNRTGRSLPPASITEWKGARVETFAFQDMSEVLAAESRENREGFVVHYPATDVRVKYKYEDYVRLHRVMTGVNSRRIWDLLRSGQPVDVFLQNVPEEFETYVRGTASRLQQQHASVVAEARAVHEATVKALPVGYTQRDYAQHVLANNSKTAASFAFLVQKGSGERLDKAVWDSIEPAHEKPFFSGQKDEKVE